MRGRIPKDQLLFEAEIEKVARRNRKLKVKEKQKDNREDSSTTSFSIHIFQEENNKAEEEAPLPRRTFGDNAIHQRPKYFSSFAIPATNKALEMKSEFLTLISTNQFTTMCHEDPHTHLATFYELVETMGF